MVGECLVRGVCLIRGVCLFRGICLVRGVCVGRGIVWFGEFVGRECMSVGECG